MITRLADLPPTRLTSEQALTIVSLHSLMPGAYERKRSQVAGADAKALLDPVRMQLWRRFRIPRPWTVKQLAEDLGTKANSLYHHIRVMEEAELIQQAGTVAEGRMVERLYSAKPASTPPAASDDPLDRAAFYATLLDVTKLEVQSAVLDQTGPHADAASRTDVNVFYVDVHTTEARYREFNHRLAKLVDDFIREAPAASSADEDGKLLGDDWRTVSMTCALRMAPLPDWWSTQR